MISSYKIKPAFQNLLRPVLSKLHELGITPNMLTLLAVILSIAMAMIFFNYPLPIIRLSLAVFFLFRMALNALDGMMATTYSMQSRLGEVLNELGDVVSDGAVYLALLSLAIDPVYVFAFVLMMVVNEFSGVLAKAVSGKRRYDGPMGKSDRALVVGLVLFISFWWERILIYLPYILMTCTVLMVFSSFIRLKRCLNE